MSKSPYGYPGDAAMKRLLKRYACPAPFHVVRMRLWGAIASPSFEVSPITTMQGLWSNGPPAFADIDEANAFIQPMMSLWNELTRYQDGSPKLRLQEIGKIDTRERFHAAAKLRVEELYDGFIEGFTDGKAELDVPPGVADIFLRVEKTIELLATMRNTFAAAPGPDDNAILAEAVRAFPMIDEAVQADLNGIAVEVKRWRKERLGDERMARKAHESLH